MKHLNLIRNRRIRTVLVIGVFVAITGMLAVLVAMAIATLTDTADLIDDQRALAAANSAQLSLQKQISGTVRDNAYWDDAYQKVAVDGDAAWAIRNWGKTTLDYPLYDTAVVLGPDNAPLIAYHDGEPLGLSLTLFFDETFSNIVAQARSDRHDPDRLPLYFIRTKLGIAVIGAAPIQPAGNAEPKPKSHVLIFAKHIGPGVVSELSANFGLPDLHFANQADAGHLQSALLDASKRPVAYLLWDPQRPGTKSAASIKPLLWATAISLVIFLAGMIAVGGSAVRTLSRDEALARHRSNHDPLTGLLNRSGLAENFQERRDGQGLSSLILIDLDGFKAVNDLWGHPVGDALIIAVADRIREVVGDAALIARLGGDEYAILELSVASDRKPDLGEALRAALCHPFNVDGRTIEIGASSGVVSIDSIDSIHDLMRKADIALYRAKDAGRNAVVHFDQSFDDERAREAAIEQDLRQAISNNDIEVAFQPLVDARTGTPKGVEALARWKSSSGVYVPPDVFIPLAERAGLIDGLGMQVMEKALLAAKQWPNSILSVNASPVQFKNPYFVEQVRQAVEKSGFAAGMLTIEITEGVLISNPEQAERAILGLKKLGIKIALDDFGSGYASIGTLRKFGFDSLKIDRSLINAIDDTPEGAQVLHSTVALANALQIPVTAEGIENERQAIAVRLAGCDQMQGYLFGRPVSAAEISSTFYPDEVKSRRKVS